MDTVEELELAELVERADPAVPVGDEGDNGVPAGVAQVEDLILWPVVVRSAQGALPVLEIGPGLFGRAAGERREAGQELE